MRSVAQLKDKVKMKNNKKKKKKKKKKNKNNTSFWISGFSVFCKISCCYLMGMSFCNCDVMMYVMQQEQLCDIPVMWRVANNFFKNLLKLSFTLGALTACNPTAAATSLRQFYLIW
jgi:hypothetical protein